MPLRARTWMLVLVLTAVGCGERTAEGPVEDASRRFEFYECVVNDQRAFVRVDVDLHDTAPDPSRPHQLRIRIALLDPKEDGLTTRGEAERLWAFEDRLCAALAPHPLVGVLTNAGRRSWYLYTDDPDRDADRARRVAREVLPDHTVRAESFEDPAWRVYLDFLYPNDLAWNWIQDRKVLEALAREGDDGTRPRPISYWARFPSPASRSGFREAVERLGYAVEELYERAEDDQDPFWIRIAHPAPLAPVDVFAASERVSIAAREAGGSYDGWETEALPPEAPSDGER